ncbi:unnamed protein product [Ranitomeya imitator]|uniref:Transposase Tc1-like domain-containing protein n=1 Tax=Ranitomeya imitator TaxID=111125 RepID=A0ABN9MHW1_9NEOB|nr:unnamed protein product [Ranitomeya imitator]
MVRSVKGNPQTTSRELQHQLAADGVTVHRSTIQRTLHKEKLYGRVMRKKPFLQALHKQSQLSANQGRHQGITAVTGVWGPGAECWTQMGQSAGHRWGRVLDTDEADEAGWKQMGQSGHWTQMGQSAGHRWSRVLDTDGAECWTQMGQSAGHR